MNYSLSTDHRRLIDGQTRIWDESLNAYVTDEAGEPLAFPLRHDAERWLEQQWLSNNGIAQDGSTR